MRVTQVSIRPTQASELAGRPSLTPELLAASGARYSRNNEGLEAILSKIDPDNLDKSVDGIFKMIDYGHQSIADMVPVAMFIDGVSTWLAYYIWTLCPTAGGQESSTRYIRISEESLVPAEALGIRAAGEWMSTMCSLFDAYRENLDLWEGVVRSNPDAARIPATLRDDPSDRAARQVARMERNYAFDRARYFLPCAAATNLMLLMSARAWVELCQHLLSHPLAEAKTCGEAIVAELQWVAPRMLRHATSKEYVDKGLREEFSRICSAAGMPAPCLDPGAERADADPNPFLQVFPPDEVGDTAVSSALAHHENRYAWLGFDLRRIAVRFGWEAVAIAELRDLNRHRTGTKYCPPIPRGFYSALDQCRIDNQDLVVLKKLEQLSLTGTEATRTALELLRQGAPEYVYWLPLGAQFRFEHTTTADKFIYEAELRTGTGAHYRYASHLREALKLWYGLYPSSQGLVLEGSAEPE